MNAVAQYQECPTMSAEGTKSAATGSPESLEEPSAARRSNVPPPIPTTLDSPVASLAVYCAKLPNSYVNSFCGAMGGMASGIVTCPRDVIKTSRLKGRSEELQGRHGHQAHCIVEC